ncbi:MAG: hypothetical protein U5O69_01730 [Candidatus Competibacteraceae bacterium]|nr:hypothetical protein [Candidatus Competibacteraceae bacterium]
MSLERVAECRWNQRPNGAGICRADLLVQSSFLDGLIRHGDFVFLTGHRLVRFIQQLDFDPMNDAS